MRRRQGSVNGSSITPVRSYAFTKQSGCRDNPAVLGDGADAHPERDQRGLPPIGGPGQI